MNTEQQEPQELARRVGFVGSLQKMHSSEKMLLKLNSGVKEFDTILRKTNKIGRVFSLGRGQFGSVSESILKRSNLIIPTKPVTIEFINKLSQFHHLSGISENKLYHLIRKGVLPVLSKEDSMVEKKRLSDCIVLDQNSERAYFAKDLDKMTAMLASRVLYYKGKLPSMVRSMKREERMYYMRDKIDSFSQEIRSLSSLRK